MAHGEDAEMLFVFFAFRSYFDSLYATKNI